jgi:hypothetical protein
MSSTKVVVLEDGSESHYRYRDAIVTWTDQLVIVSGIRSAAESYSTTTSYPRERVLRVEEN